MVVVVAVINDGKILTGLPVHGVYLQALTWEFDMHTNAKNIVALLLEL